METLVLMERLPADSDVHTVEACYLETCAEMTTTITYRTLVVDPQE